MQPTTTGQNRTGAATNPSDVVLMMNAVEELSPYMPIDNVPIENERMKHISNADSVGSIPPPATLLKGTVKKTVAVMNGVNPNLLLDKIGERLAFERTGTRLYDALISKYVALSELDGGELRLMESLEETRDTGAPAEERWTRDAPLEVLRRIRNEEHSHFLMLCAVMTQLGGDATAQTPCADVAGTATMGVLQVVTDPRTTFAQCLNAALIAELTDTASWELLAELATTAGQAELAEKFQSALAAEETHLAVVKSWLRALTLHGSGTPAV